MAFNEVALYVNIEFRIGNRKKFQPYKDAHFLAYLLDSCIDLTFIQELQKRKFSVCFDRKMGFRFL